MDLQHSIPKMAAASPTDGIPHANSALSLHVAAIKDQSDKLGYVTRCKPTLENVIDHTDWEIRADVGRYIHRFPSQASNNSDWEAWTKLFNMIMYRPLPVTNSNGARALKNIRQVCRAEGLTPL